MKKLETIDWIFFDVGGVLTDDTVLEATRDTVVSEAVSPFRVAPTAEELRQARVFASVLLGNLTDNMIAALLSDTATIPNAQALVKDIWKGYPPMATLSTVKPEAKTVLEQLASRYKLGVMANQPTTTREKFDRAGISLFFSQSGMSNDYGFHKPDPRLYEAVLRETGACAERSVMIDDNYERGLKTAKDLGFKTVWLVKADMDSKGDEWKPDWSVERLEDLLQLL